MVGPGYQGAVMAQRLREARMWVWQALWSLCLAPYLSWDAGEEGVWGPISKVVPLQT